MQRNAEGMRGPSQAQGRTLVGEAELGWESGKRKQEVVLRRDSRRSG